ncbi:DNA polymerase III subunit delta [Bacteroidales bacterium OttesenSCG-928-M11]|nr:DNA polymerase III subunit delta [Bacteroidales bacterium OttesenSCG-928-M11]
MYFKDIISHQEIKQDLIRSLKEGFIPHARLISGNEGTGALPLAISYARYLHCTNRGEEDSCGICPACQKINKLSHPDLHFVFPIINKKKGKDAYSDDFLPEWREYLQENPYTNLSSWLNYIDAENAQGMIYEREAKSILQKLSLKAYESTYKIMVIWLPEKMNVSAANKLLKLLEEPPEGTIFLLVSEEPDKVIGTIQSRTQSLRLPPIKDEEIEVAIQKEYDISAEDAQWISHLANGNYLRAIQTIESTEETEIYLELFISIMRNSWKRDIKNIKTKGDYFASLGRDKQKGFLAYCQRLIRENFVLKLNLQEINYLNKKEAQFSANFAPYVNEGNVFDFMKELSLAEQHIEQNVNPRMVFFDISLKIAVLLKK